MGKVQQKADVQFVVGPDGARTAVLVPIDTWRRIRRRLKPKRSKELLKQDLQEAINEIKTGAPGWIEYKSMAQLLDEV